MIFPGETQDATPTDIVSKHFFKAFQPLNSKIGLTGRKGYDDSDRNNNFSTFFQFCFSWVEPTSEYLIWDKLPTYLLLGNRPSLHRFIQDKPFMSAKVFGKSVTNREWQEPKSAGSCKKKVWQMQTDPSIIRCKSIFQKSISIFFKPLMGLFFLTQLFLVQSLWRDY